jgi:DNA-binding CsgD family transcriptional regulator
MRGGVRELVAQASADIVGREAELAALHDFVGAESPRSLVLAGGPGIGKTTLWEAGIAAARERGARVLATRASEAEAQLSFAGLIDLFDGIERAHLDRLPAPQLRALEVALLRAEPGESPPESRAIALGALNTLRALAARERLLVAVDDVPWLDAASADALVFAVRRLEPDPIAFLLAKRTGPASAVERALEPRGLEQIDVGPLSLGAIRRLLAERLGLALPRHVLRRIVETTLGNPLFALEVGRSLAEHGVPAIGEELPVPDAVEDLLGTRVARLSASTRRLLLAVALNAELRPAQLAALADADALDEAVDAGVLVVDGVRVRASHPLLAAAANKHGKARDRRELHRALAGAVADGELRARHLALAADAPDEKLAATVARAAATAFGRGARQEAVELGEHALRLTPAGSRARSERVLALSVSLAAAGEAARLTELLAPELDSLPPGSARVQACLLMNDGLLESYEDVRRYQERALAAAGSDRALRSGVLAEMASNAAAARVEQIGEAEAWALEAVAAAPDADVERQALCALAWARALRGCAIDDLCDRSRDVSPTAAFLAYSPERVAAQRLFWRGEIHSARVAVTGLLALADERGEAVSFALLRLHLCELELRAGLAEAAARLLDEWAEPSERALLPWPMYERCRALTAAVRGLPREAETWAAEAIARAEETLIGWDRLEGLRARGIAALLAHEPARAVESLTAVWEHVEREGVEEPGVFPVSSDLVEALVELGELAEARAVTRHLHELSEQQDHPWGLASAQRCQAVERLVSRYDEGAAGALEQAAADYQTLGLRFDRARSLLALGRLQRKHRKWGAARSSLAQAAAAFDEIDSVGWADLARSELARVGSRRPRPAGELTPSEQRVAELAAEGLANKEIAQTLFVTVRTVEEHLSHAYAKLGIRSRSQLAGRLKV